MNVTIYSTTTCSSCHALTQWLEKAGVSYAKKNTDEDAAVMSEFMAVNEGMIGVPFTVVDDNGQLTKISGLNLNALKDALHITS